MSRFIDAEKAKAEFTGNFIDEYSPSHIKALIDEVPTADVAPVIHAHWNPDSFQNDCGGKYEYFRCSACGREVRKNKISRSTVSEVFPYCHCGARMDEVITDD